MNRFLFLLCFILSSFILEATTYYISPSTGNDTNTGLTANAITSGGPFKTINKAISILNDNDIIVLMRGNYFEQIFLRGKNNITIKTNDDGPVTLYGTYDPSQRLFNWRKLRVSPNQKFRNEQSIYVSKLPPEGIGINAKLPEYYEQFNYIFDKKENQFFGYRYEDKFNNRSNNHTAGEGYWFGNGNVYVAVNDPSKLMQNELFITKSGSTIRLSGGKGFKLLGSEIYPTKIKYGGRYGLSAEGDISGMVIQNIEFDHVSLGIYFFGISGKEITIDKCKFTYKVSDNWIWQDVKASHLESSGIGYANGNVDQLIIKNNTFEGVFNGVMSLPGNTDIYDNYFYNIGDDAIELDGPAVNCKVYNNLFENCFTAFSLCPVEDGPVYIYNNVVYSSIESYPFEELPDGSLRKVKPKTFKFWNLTGGNRSRNGHLMKVSGNVHVYHNTIVLNEEPFSIGNYGSKHLSPEHSTFYNNIFFSNGVLTNSTGFQEDDIDIDNNLFISSKLNKGEDRLFIGWNGNSHLTSLRNDKTWSNNLFLQMYFYPKEIKKSAFVLSDKTAKSIQKKYKLRDLPDHFPKTKKYIKPGFNI